MTTYPKTVSCFLWLILFFSILGCSNNFNPKSDNTDIKITDNCPSSSVPEKINGKISFPAAQEYNEILKKTEYVSEQYLSTGLYTDWKREQRDRLAKRIEDELSTLGEVPLFLVENHRKKPDTLEIFSFNILTDKTYHDIEWEVHFDQKLLGSIRSHKEIPLTPKEVTAAQKMLNLTPKLKGTFLAAPYFYANPPVWYVTIWQDAKNNRYTFAVPVLMAPPYDHYYPHAEEYKNICDLYKMMNSKLSNIKSQDEEYIMILRKQMYGISSEKSSESSSTKPKPATSAP